jgi:hypothetical protein
VVLPSLQGCPHLRVLRPQLEARDGGVVRVPAQAQQAGQVKDRGVGSEKTLRRREAAELQALRTSQAKEHQLRAVRGDTLMALTLTSVNMVISLKLS